MYSKGVCVSNFLATVFKCAICSGVFNSNKDNSPKRLKLNDDLSILVMRTIYFAKFI